MFPIEIFEVRKCTPPLSFLKGVRKNPSPPLVLEAKPRPPPPLHERAQPEPHFSYFVGFKASTHLSLSEVENLTPRKSFFKGIGQYPSEHFKYGAKPTPPSPLHK